MRRVHAGAAVADDFAGATATLTNPGTLGTVQSVPRLMPGQGVIVGVGALAWPAGFDAADPRSLAEVGVGKVVTLTSTYDHRIIQGAESGLFLRHVAECLTGGHGFYDDVFASVGVPAEPARWAADRHAGLGDEAERVAQAGARPGADQHVPGARPPPRPPRPAVVGAAAGAPRARARHLRADHLGPAADVRDRRPGRPARGDPRGDPVHPARRLLPEPGHRVRPHHGPRAEALDPGPRRGGRDARRRPRSSARSSTRSARPRSSSASCTPATWARSASASRAPSRRSWRCATVLDAAADEGLREAVIGMAHRGRLNVLANVVGKSYSDIFSEFEGNLDPESVQGSGDVKYHKGARGVYKNPRGATIEVSMASNPTHLEAVCPVVEGIARAKQDALVRPGDGSDPHARPAAFPILPVLIHGDAAFAGQGVVAETLNLSQLSRLPHRRRDPRRHQQPGRLHHRAGVGALELLPDRRGQDDPGADPARQRRRPRGLRARGAPGLRLPTRVPPRRRRRRRVLPAPRPQRGRRPELHPAPDVPRHRRDAPGAHGLHRVARAPRRPLAGRGRGHARRVRRAPRARAGRGARGARARALGAARARGPGRRARARDRRARRRRWCAWPPPRPRPPRGSASTPSSRASSPSARRWSARARSTGRWPRPWRSAACWPRASTCAWSARTRAGARSPSATRRSSTTTPARRGSPSRTWARGAAASRCATRC